MRPAITDKRRVRGNYYIKKILEESLIVIQLHDVPFFMGAQNKAPTTFVQHTKDFFLNAQKSFALPIKMMHANLKQVGTNFR